MVSLFNRRVFHYSQPFDYSGIQWGWIHVGLSLESYDRSVNQVYRRTGVLAVVCVVLSLMASVIYAKRLVRPILSLREAVQKVAGGDWSARATVQTGDEIENLSRSFNRMTDALLQRDRILQSVRYAGQKLLSTVEWQEVIEEVLGKIGGAAGASRAYIFENHAGPGGSLVTSQRYEYAAPGQIPLVHTSKLQNLPWYGTGFESWAEGLQRGETFSGHFRDLNAAQQRALAPQGIRSLILVPIMTGRDWWGYLGMDECTRERTWTDAERDSLRAAADMLGAAIERQRAQRALIEAKETLEHRVLERTKELQEQVVAREKAHAALAEAQQRLMEASRLSGMADVATGVLHNVGNVLNSVNVSASLVAERVRQSRVDNLAATADLLEAHAGDLAGFLTSDPKGKLVPGYLRKLSVFFQEEKAAQLREVESLLKNVEHIKEVVAMQQNYAQVSGVIEPFSLAGILEDAVQTLRAALGRHHIRVHRHFEPVPPVVSDRYKVMQILLNLLRNAQQAVLEAGQPEKHIALSICALPANRVRVQVRDNGVGIPPKNLTRIFSHGFTTKREGHGFGLHSGALAAQELGGALTVESAGLGQGSTFTLELPLVRGDQPALETPS
ncbi:MAG: HAMP domain-containing protein [Verrucomicrobia bacterium]|nr:HAMP domain-containing protein [Verrucomicrobiota bacterium]